MVSILTIGILFLISQVLNEWLKDFGIPQLISYVIVGIVVGPCVLNLVNTNEILYTFSELGILFLLYQSGLEIHLNPQLKTTLQSIAIAITGSLVPFFMAIGLATYLGYNKGESLFLAGSLTATSIGITLKTFIDLKKQHTNVANIVLIAAVIDDIIGIVVLIIVSNFAHNGNISLEGSISIILYSIMLFLMTPFIKIIFKNIFNLSFNKSATYLSAIIIFAIVGYSFVSYKLIHLNILGAFIIGYCLQTINTLKTKEATNLLNKSKQYLSIIQKLFEPFFFIYIGLSFNLKYIDFSEFQFLYSLLLFLLVAIIGKLLSGFWIKGIYNKLAVGIAMIPRAEVGLIFAAIGKSSGILNNETYALIVLISLLTTFIAPFALQFMYSKIA